MVAVLPSLVMQLAVVVGAFAVMAGVVIARAGRVLNPAWLIVAWLYLLGPIGSLLNQFGIGLSAAALVLLAPAPFVAAAVFARPQVLGRTVVLAPLALLLALASVSLWWSPDASYGIEKLTLWTLTGFLPAAFIVLLADARSGVDWRLIAGAALLYALGVLVFGAGTPLTSGRATLFGANPIWVARATFIGALVVLFGPFPRFVKLTIAPVMIVAGITTVSLGPAIGLVVGAWAGAAEALRCAGRHDRRVAVGWACLLIVAVLAVEVALSGALDPMLTIVATDPNTTSRQLFLVASGQLFLQAPVFGVGFGGFAVSGLDVYPHNVIAETASELGTIGVLLLLAWVILALRGAARSPIMVSLVVATIVFSLFSGNIPGNAEFWLFSALAVAMAPGVRNHAARDAQKATGGSSFAPTRQVQPS